MFRCLRRSFVKSISGHAALALLTFLVADSAHAQTSNAERDRADRLFEDAKALMAQNRFFEACPKLVEARRIEPNAGGTLLALALCHEGEQKLATALAELREAKRVAQGKNADREALAGEHIEGIVSHVPTITIRHADRATVLTVDGRAIATAAETRVEVDGGEHSVHAESPGKIAWEQRITLSAKDDARIVDLPELAQIAPPPSPIASPSTEPTSKSGGTRTLGLVVGGAGIVVTLVGGYFGLSALKAQSDSLAKCSSSPCSDQAAVARHTDAQHAAIGADIGIGIGVATMAAGALLILIDRGPSSNAMIVAPTLTDRSAGLGVLGRF